jgi:hypothetical protein
MRKYPIGKQSFKGIIQGGFMYVDKTEQIHTLIESGDYYFLSRPRRFGKSLLLSTIEEIFKGSKELFEGLWIFDHWDWNQQYPVIHISFSDIGVQTLGLEQAIFEGLGENAQRLDVTLTKTTIDLQLKELVQKVAGNSKVVILIDEYDKPIIDNLDNFTLAEANRAIMKNFYSVLKGADQYIRLLLITGVSRFSKVSIFSDLNNLRDITLVPTFATLTGITQEELESNFAEEISELQNADPDILQYLKTWYNGYSWNKGKNTVYNPFSLLNFMADKEFKNYWFQTGTPSFLIKEVQENPEFSFSEDEFKVGEEALNDLFGKNEGKRMNPITLMFQTGYLTIKSYNQVDELYTLGYPNREVKVSVLTYLIFAYSFNDLGNVRPTVTNLRQAFINNNIPAIIDIVDTLFATIPNPLWIGARESFFHGLLHNTFQLLGINPESEVSSSNGRADFIVKTPTRIYIMEFKLNGSPSEALNQILQKGYLRPYQLDPRKKTLIGINFSSTKRQVEGYEVKDVE